MRSPICPTKPTIQHLQHGPPTSVHPHTHIHPHPQAPPWSSPSPRQTGRSGRGCGTGSRWPAPSAALRVGMVGRQVVGRRSQGQEVTKGLAEVLGRCAAGPVGGRAHRVVPCGGGRSPAPLTCRSGHARQLVGPCRQRTSAAWQVERLPSRHSGSAAAARAAARPPLTHQTPRQPPQRAPPSPPG